MSYHKMTLRELAVGEVNEGRKGAFGILRRAEDQQLYLVSQRRWLPIEKLRIFLRNQGGETFEWTEKDFDLRGAFLKLQDEETLAIRSEFIIFEGEESGRDILSSEAGDVQGFIFVKAIQHSAEGKKPYIMSAVYGYKSGRSSLLADGNKEIVEHIDAVSALMRKMRSGF